MTDAAPRFETHRVQWTREKSARLWDHMTAEAGYQDRNFAVLLGPPLVRFLQRKHVPLTGRVLDFGSGSGFFAERLLQAGARCTVADSSPAAVQAAAARLDARSGFEGAHRLNGPRTPFADATFDVVFVVETLEHLLDAEVAPTLGDLRRILKPGGYLIATTPHDEDLRVETILCPDCGCVFHRAGHVRRFTRNSLVELMSASGFAARLCEATTLRPPSLWQRMRAVVAFLRKERKLNLVYVGYKAGNA